MKKLGIIGGAGPLASSLFYEMLVHACYEQKMHIPEIFLINYPFTRALTLQESKENSRTLIQELQYTIEKLQLHDAKIGVIVCNTLHRYLTAVSSLRIPIVSIPQTIQREAIRNGHHNLLILGTQNTCEHGVYAHPKITCFYPNRTQQEVLDHIIDRVLHGHLCPEDAFLLSQLINEIATHVSFDGVVLGCTDLPVLHDHYPIACNVFVYDSIKIPAQHILGRLL